MKKFFLFFALVFFSPLSQAQTFHDFSEPTIYGDTLDFSVFYGKKVLVVNTASFCAFTYEYGLLQELYDQYGGTDFEIIGFPSDDFNQESDDDSTIIEFCLDTYGITFQMMSLTTVSGNQISDIYDWLTHESLNGVADAPVLWNFQKFAIDELGHWVTWYPTAMSPLDTTIVNWILSPSVIPTSIETQSSQQNGLMVHQQGNMMVEYYSETGGEVSFTFSDILGRKIVAKHFIAAKGINRFEFTTPTSGIYVASAIAGRKNVSEKIAVVH
ncbi:MAG TPA: glutathione peroxidase [Chitinophagales bacterium]|nr:glutathione peroxidase [Chitinophagales bacterium]